jgi:hypothetical protein
MTVALLAIAVVVGTAAQLYAHEVRPAYLELRQTSPEVYDVLWKVPSRGDLRLGLYVRLPNDVKEQAPPRGAFAGDAYVERWRIQRRNGLAGARVGIDGLESTVTDVLVRVEHGDGTTQVARLLPSAPSFVVQSAPNRTEVAATYLRLGVEHILLGVDHLLFVLALLFLVQGWRRVLGTITAFTAAHTMTLAAATLGYVHVPSRPVEASIALSIVFVAVEIIHGRQGRPGVTQRRPWIVALVFGLLHGLGFAGALSEVGLPPGAIPLALLFFNVGVEIGQLLFIAVATAVLFAWRRMEVGSTAAMSLEAVAAYGIGGVAAFWMIERTLAFWS